MESWEVASMDMQNQQVICPKNVGIAPDFWDVMDIVTDLEMMYGKD